MSRSFRSAVAVLLGVAVVAGVLAVRPVESQTPPSPTPKSGGSLNVMLREDLSPGFAIHETSTIGTVFPASPCFNNLVYFDPLKSKESVDTIIGELAQAAGLSADTLLGG